MRIAFGIVLAAAALLPATAAGQVPKLPRGPIAKAADAKTPANATWGGKTLIQWVSLLTSPDASKRTNALLALMHFEEAAAKVVVPYVIPCLHDRDVSVRAKAAFVLRYLAVDEKDVSKVVMALAARLYPPGTSPGSSESQAIIRYEAAKTLKRFTPDAAPAIPALVRGTLDVSSWEIRQLCVSILWRVAIENRTDPDPAAVTGLLDALRLEKTFEVRLEIFQGLALMGKPANPQLLAREISDLSLCTRHSNKALVIWAYAGMAVLGDAAMARKAMGNITKYLDARDRGQDLEIRAQAAHALGTLGPLAQGMVPSLLLMLKDKEAVAVNGACLALIRIKDTSDKVVDALLEVLNHKDPQRAMSAVKALVDLKVNSSRVTGAMDKLREKKDLDLNLRSWLDDALKELKKVKK